MTVRRTPTYPVPLNLETLDDVKDYLRKLHNSLSQEGHTRLRDFDATKIGNSPHVDVRTYGAKGDEVTDDTLAIQSAIDVTSGNTERSVVFLPSGVYVVGALTLRDGTEIRGEGETSIIRHRAASTSHLFTLGTRNVHGVSIQGVMLDGNKANQTNAVDVIHLDNTGGTFPYCDDPLHTLTNIYIYQPKRDGVYFGASGTATQGCVLTNVYVYQADRYGFNLAGADNRYIACHAGNCANHGWYISEGSSTFIGIMGYGSDGSGAYVTATATSAQFIGCHFQENAGNGMTIDGGGGHVLSGCVLDYNDNGLVLTGKTQYNTVGDSKCSENTTYELSVGSECGYNKIQIMVGEVSKINIAEANNEIHINNQEGYREITYAATITPEPYYGSWVYVLLTGNITFNPPSSAHAGCTLKFMLLQDGSGGHTITFDAAYKTTWTPAKTANKYDLIEFVFDGASWIEKSSRTGVG